MNLGDFWKWAGVSPEEYAKSGMLMAKGKEEGDYPNFDQLVLRAQHLLDKEILSDDDMNLFFTIMALDNETEDVLDYSILHASENQIQQLVNFGITCTQPNARWQLAEMIFRRKPKGYYEYLQRLSADPDDYVRKRANNCLEKC